MPPKAAFLSLLLLLPSFFVLAPATATGAPAPGAAPAALPQSTSSSGVNSLTSYKAAGPADPNMPVLVSVVIPLRNIGALSSIVKESSDPNSADYRHFLTYSQVQQEFLPTQQEYQSVVNYLTSSGFTIEFTALNSTISVLGTAAMVSKYLGQGVEMYTNGTYSYYATTGASTLSGAYSYGSNSTGLLMRPDFVKSAAAASGAIPDQNVTFTEGGQDTKLLQTVYNSTGLLAQGINGKGYTVGLLDFFGSPFAQQDLATFDQTYGYPTPPSFKISPIGLYNPNLGVAFGWDGEIDLDIQVSHAMAPGANIILYAANGALPLSTAIAAIVQDGRANVVSQSFGIPEWDYYEAGPLPYLFNSLFADDYYMLGSAMGMSFLTSSGDGGGSGESAGPMDGIQYPAASPFNTVLGGTATYITTGPGGSVVSFNQTAWSNIGFVPYFVNLGGGGGGVSTLEPTPWYQSSLPVPASFPDGRMVPDLSLDASGTPGTFIIIHGSPSATGGTSESSPLFAGLLTLLMGVQKGGLGLVNPTLYKLAENPKTYTTAFDPITFGYTIPWTAKFGYNLATGWGAPNIGEIARLYGSAGGPSTLNVNVQVVNPGKDNFTDFIPGQKMGIVASVTTPLGTLVTSGTFTATVQTLGGVSAPVTLAYSATQRAWTGVFVVGNQSGVAFVNVAGSDGSGNAGQGFAPTFVGFLANFVEPLAPYPWTYLPSLLTAISITDLFGNLPILPNGGFPSTMPVAFQSYSILGNTYKAAGTALLNFSSANDDYEGQLKANFPSGPMALVTQGPVVGYLPYVSGIGLLGSDIYPQVVAEPGSVAPGQSLTIVASLTAPENVYNSLSYATGQTLGTTIPEGASVSATLVSPTGFKVETVNLAEQACSQALKVCGNGITDINGYLTIPRTATPGLYTVMLNAGYNDESSGYNFTGSYFGQIYVSSGASLPKVSIGPSTLFEGENATITASITYPNGKEVTKGLYSALVYPETSQNDYSTIMHSTYSAFGLIPLSYDTTANDWTASVTLPSPADSSLVASINGNAEYYGGPYDVYVSGISADGVPTNSSLSAQQAFFVEPYVLSSNTVVTDPPLTTRVAFANDTINGGTSALTLTGDYFLGTDTITGTDVTVASSIVNGTLDINGGLTTLVGVTGGAVTASNSKVILQHSDLVSLNLSQGGTASIDSASTYGSITPALPSLTILSPVANASYAGSLQATVVLTGTSITGLSFLLDGKQLPAQGSGTSTGRVLYSLNTTSIPDGTHTLTVVATQSDLLTTSASVSFSTDNQLEAGLQSANRTIGSLNSSLATANVSISTLQNNLNSANHTISDLTELAYLAVAVALLGIVLAAFALRGEAAPWKY